jgi:hypothetical protein
LLLRFNVYCCAAHIAQRIGPCLWGVTVLWMIGGACHRLTQPAEDLKNEITPSRCGYGTRTGVPAPCG